ncbi:DNA polymerase-3 subunit delta' [Sanguibacter gelidistatuariae]|uniref:DNA polymerase-3 subunit delta n=1 Tax=Sanguibacter gelidistatuariae TaxID=1814289 RepID=A0A1G6HNT0_9MICO|nr:DNA polymerase III subunit delta' [Sanguibacter gelidistatuariae]SDB95987.1 DNA polymerase-3 subunit delta' [Sanguibacter gelidistatuariae]
MSVWDDVVGQESAVAVLRGAIADPAAMTHAWLLTGPPGSGRSNAARAFAAALQCEQGGCGHCQACTTTLAGTHADLTVVATEKVTIAIDEVRSLIMSASRTPSQGRWRVILIEDADRMAERTTNVLLKAIEEPPPRTVWLLCAPSPQDVMVTIRSRCRGVTLRIPPVEDVAALLVARDGIDPATALTSARAAQSHIGLARRLARDAGARDRRAAVLAIARRIRGVPDAVIAAGELVEVAQTEAKAATEERDATEKAALLRSLGAEAGQTLPPSLRSQVKQLEDDQKRRATRRQRDVIDRSMIDLLSLYRDVLMVQLRAEVDLVNVELDETVRTLAEESTPEQTIRRMDAIGVARTRLGGNVSPVLALEAMAIALRPQG